MHTRQAGRTLVGMFGLLQPRLRVCLAVGRKLMVVIIFQLQSMTGVFQFLFFIQPFLILFRIIASLVVAFAHHIEGGYMLTISAQKMSVRFARPSLMWLFFSLEIIAIMPVFNLFHFAFFAALSAFLRSRRFCLPSFTGAKLAPGLVKGSYGFTIITFGSFRSVIERPLSASGATAISAPADCEIVAATCIPISETGSVSSRISGFILRYYTQRLPNFPNCQSPPHATGG